MRKTLRLLLTICLLTLGHPLYADQIFNSSTGTISEGTQTPIKRVITPFDDGFRVAYTFPNYVMEEDNAHPGTYRFLLNEFNSFAEPGAPAIPSKEEIFYVPDCESASVEILNALYYDYSFNIATNTYEYAGEGRIGPDVVTPFDGFHAESPITEFKGFTYRNHEAVRLIINPILYNYNEKKIRVYTILVYKVSYSPHIVASAQSSSLVTKAINKIEFDWDQPMWVPNEITIFDTKTMLIITSDSLVPSLQRFVEWKKTLGIDTHILTEKGFDEDISDPYENFTVESIKQKINFFYRTHENLEYLLFVGDHSIVPGDYYSHDNNYYYDEEKGEDDYYLLITTDYPYATITNDFIPEVMYGRLPVSNRSELDIVIDKIIRYEKDPPRGKIGLQPDDFYSTGLHMAYIDTTDLFNDDVLSGNDWSAFIPASEEISQYITKVTSKKINKLYSLRAPGSGLTTHWSKRFYTGEPIPDSLGLLDPQYKCQGFNKFIEELNKGRFYAMYQGHGLWKSFYNFCYTDEGKFFDTDSIEKLTNIDKLPVIFSMACETANITRESIGKKLLTYKNGGAVGFLGNTTAVPKGPSEQLGVVLMHSIWPTDTLHSRIHGQGAVETTFYPVTHSKTESNLRLGAIHREGIKRMRDFIYPSSRYGFHCLGDPSMEMRTESPSIPMVIYTLTDSTLKVSAPDSECRISIYDRKNQIVQSVVGDSYEFTVEKGEKDISLCVNKSNCIPYIVEKLKITSVYPPIIIVNCESVSPNSIDVICSVGENESDVSIIATNMLTGETTSNPVTESGESLTRLSVSKSGSYVVGLTQRGQIIDSKKIIVK